MVSGIPLMLGLGTRIGDPVFTWSLGPRLLTIIMKRIIAAIAKATNNGDS